MDPDKFIPTPHYEGPGHTMKELHQMPLMFLGLNEGINLNTLGMVMELCRFGEMDFCSPEEVIKVTKMRTTLKDTMQGEIPLKEEVTETVIAYIMGKSVRFGSPIELACVRVLENGVTISADVFFCISDSINMSAEDTTVTIDTIDKNDINWLMENGVFGRARVMAESLNCMLQGDYSIGKSSISAFETTSDMEGFTAEEAAIEDAGTFHKGLYPSFWNSLEELSQNDTKIPVDDDTKVYKYKSGANGNGEGV